MNETYMLAKNIISAYLFIKDIYQPPFIFEKLIKIQNNKDGHENDKN